VERKRSLIVAGAVSGTLLAASTAYALTGGLLDRPADDGAGTLAPVTATIQDAPATSATAPAPPVRLPDVEPVTRSRASATGHPPDDERIEREEVREHGTGEPGHVYEGADDDD
jgi:hypothetical protein